MNKVGNNIHNYLDNHSEIDDTKKCPVSQKKVRFQLPETPINFVNEYVIFL